MNNPKAIAAILALGAITVASAQTAPKKTEVTGTISYRERVALPSSAVVPVRLEDVSLADAPSKFIAEYRFMTGGKQPPFSYRLPFAPGAIQKNHRYQVRASISVADVLWFTTTTANPVISNGVYKANLVLNKVSMIKTNITNVEWALEEINGHPAEPGRNGAPNLKLDTQNGRLTGNTGINQFSGTFKVTGNNLELQPGAMTKMAGPEPLMKQERAFIEVLRTADAYRFVNGKLEVLSHGKVIARFAKK